MFVTTQTPATNFAFPDICNTTVGPAVVPLPYPNIAMSSVAVPTVYNQFVSVMNVHNQLTYGTVSLGDNSGLLLGVASGMTMGPHSTLLGSIKVFNSVAPATKMLALTGANGISPNMVGTTLSPSQVKVMVLS
jgi:hypothetical protein